VQSVAAPADHPQAGVDLGRSLDPQARYELASTKRMRSS
jgi:hypothetical protein